MIESKDLKNYIILESNDHPTIYVAKHKLALDKEVERISKNLGLTLQNTAKESNGHEYIGNIQWDQALDLTHKLNGFTLPPLYFAEFLRLLDSEKAYDGNGKEIQKEKLNQILDEILTVRSPWRAEWLNAKFDEKGKELQITYHKFNPTGNLVKVTEPLDKDTLMKDKIPGISLDHWLNNATSQGLPIKKTPKGDLYYWYPTDEFVTWFLADSDWAGLSCDGNPRSSDPSLGVRLARVAKN